MVVIADGLWWDHSKPPVLAATLTLPVDSGYLLLSGLTSSALDLQYQVSLRNSAGAARTIWEVFQIHQAWSTKRPRQLLRRTCSAAIPAFIVSTCFAAAALFTSRVANKAYGPAIARAQPNNCGIWDLDLSNPEDVSLWTARVRDDAIWACNYVANFYSNTSRATVRSVFVQPRLPYRIDTSAPCPIPAAERCILGPGKAFSVTSDLLGSHQMLGINAKLEDRINVQLRSTCSPVRISDLVRVSNISQGSLIEISLGSVLDMSNITYRYKIAMADNTGIGYTLRSFMAFSKGAPVVDTSNWRPIPEFRRADADVSVHFLNQNDMRYSAPIHDPWFSANGTYNYTYQGLLSTLADAYVSTMVCADQYVWCNPSTSLCTPPGGIFHLTQHLTQNTLMYNTAQAATAARLMANFGAINTFNTLTSLGADGLWAHKMAIGNISPGLPDNQWQIEVLGWFQTNLARMQANVVEFASKAAGTAPSSGNTGSRRRLTMMPMTQAQREQCDNQLVQAVGEVQNFSLLGVLVIVCVSVIVVLVDCSLQPIVDFIVPFLGRRSASTRDARQADSKLHLARMALTRATKGGNEWELGSWSVPVLGDEAMRSSRVSTPDGLAYYVESAEVAGHQSPAGDAT
ncbi:hypothetical protein MFIFM68171_05441 [Madurella fahalii]|uniref:Uncharacterized protein n=1 Tax=Madurella fahalii TaxID=1157608 RepID=A0ABQ0GBV3_9PEZI